MKFYEPYERRERIEADFTAKEQRTAREIQRVVPDIEYIDALIFASLFMDYISKAPGGFRGLYKSGPPDISGLTGWLWDYRRGYGRLVWPDAWPDVGVTWKYANEEYFLENVLSDQPKTVEYQDK